MITEAEVDQRRALGWRQEGILTWILQEEQRVQEMVDANTASFLEECAIKWGCVLWYPASQIRQIHGFQIDASERAALSRALRQLEQRGLVVRGNKVSGCENGERWRTTEVGLTDLGRETATELVNKKGDQNC